MARVRSNRVCFTLNNYEISDIDIIEQYAKQDIVKYLVVGQEIGENGTPHLQGFVHIEKDRKACGINFWKKELQFSQPAHYENARGSDEQNKNYCVKDGPYFEKGEPTDGGSIWANIVQDCETLKFEEICQKYPEQAIKHASNIQSIIDSLQKPRMSSELQVLRPWQEQVLAKLENQSERQVLFVIDETGGKGKSALAKHLITTRNTWACQGGKINDLMYSFDTNCEIAVFDMARCNNPDYFPWNFIENIKNGWFTSTKYKGGMKIFNAPKVVVFMNQHPPEYKLTSDRYDKYII